MRPRETALAQATAAVVFWGGSFIATKVALRELTPPQLILLRFTLGVAVLGALLAGRRSTLRVAPADLPLLAFLGFLGIPLHQGLQATGLLTAQATTTAWVVATTPVFIALLGWATLRERLTPLQLTGIAVAASGVLLVVGRGDVGGVLRGSEGTVGDGLVLLSAAAWAVFSIVSRSALRARTPAVTMFYVMGFGWAITLAIVLAGNSLPPVSSLSGEAWTAVGFLGVFCSGIAFTFWYDALREIPAAQVGSMMYLEPFVALLVAAAVLGERMTPLALAGGALILAGVWAVTRRTP